MRRKLIKIEDFSEIWATGYQVEGTTLYILELQNFGFANSSYYLLLRSKSFLSHLDDPKIKEELLQKPSHFGKKCAFGNQLERDPKTEQVYYIEADEN